MNASPVDPKIELGSLGSNLANTSHVTSHHHHDAKLRFLHAILARCQRDCEMVAANSAKGGPRWTAESARALAYKDAAERVAMLAGAPLESVTDGGKATP